MRKEKLGLLGLFLMIALNIYAQPKVNIDDNKDPDTASVNAMLQESKDLLKTDIAKAISRATLAGEMADKISYPQGKALALKNIGIGYFRQGNYLETLNKWFESLAIFESIDDQTGIANLLNNIAAVYNIQGDDAKSSPGF